MTKGHFTGHKSQRRYLCEEEELWELDEDEE